MYYPSNPLLYILSLHFDYQTLDHFPEQSLLFFKRSVPYCVCFLLYDLDLFRRYLISEIERNSRNLDLDNDPYVHSYHTHCLMDLPNS